MTGHPASPGRIMLCVDGRRPRMLVLLMLLVASAAIAGRASAQGAQYRLCSSGANDGRPCQTHADCPGGACVRAQGVCNDQDGLPCQCFGGTCSAQGACSGGILVGSACDPADNCAAGVDCVGTQMICVDAAGGSSPSAGSPCVTSTQCGAAQCRSTGRICSSEGTTYPEVACAQDADCCTRDTSCPVGGCLSPAMTPTASNTPIRSTPTPVASATLPPASRPPAHMVESVGEGAGCAVATTGDHRFTALLVGVLALGLRRRSLTQPSADRR